MLVRISETELGLVIRVPEEGQKFLDGQLFGEMIRHVCDATQVASAAKQSKGLSFPKTTGVAKLRPTSDDSKETVRGCSSELMNDRDNRDVGLTSSRIRIAPPSNSSFSAATTPICVSLAVVGETPPWARAGQ